MTWNLSACLCCGFDQILKCNRSNKTEFAQGPQKGTMSDTAYTVFDETQILGNYYTNHLLLILNIIETYQKSDIQFSNGIVYC